MPWTGRNCEQAYQCGLHVVQMRCSSGATEKQTDA